MKKLIALLLVFSIISLYGNLYANERRGADLKIQKKDAQELQGELITIKKDSLLLKDAGSGADISVDIGDINKITIVKKSKAVWGILIGGGLGALIATAIYEEQEDLFEVGPTSGQVVAGAAILCLLIGGGMGAVAGIDKTIQIEGKSESEIQQILEELRKEARVPDFQ